MPTSANYTSLKPQPWAVVPGLSQNPDLWRDTRCVVPMWEGTGTPYDYAKRERLLKSASATWATCANGPCIRLNTGADNTFYYDDASKILPRDGGEITIIAYWRPYGFNSRFGTSDGGAVRCEVTATGTQAVWDCGGATEGAGRLTATYSGEPTAEGVWVFVGGPSGMSIHLNGVKLGSNASTTVRNVNFDSGENFGLGASWNITGSSWKAPGAQSDFSYFQIVWRKLSDGEIEGVSKDVFQLVNQRVEHPGPAAFGPTGAAPPVIPAPMLYVSPF